MNQSNDTARPACRNAADPEFRVRFLLRATKAELEKMRGRSLCYEELGRYAGQAASTIFKRLQNNRHPAVEGLISWFERVPDNVRHYLLDQACRCFPRLDDVRLNYDLAQVSALRALAGQTSGISIVRGELDGVRSFVICALAHEAEMSQGETAVAGLDLHRPDWFVPLSQVKYLHDLPDANLVPAIQHAIGRLLAEEGKMIIINAVHPACDAFWHALNRLACKCHVVVAEDSRVIKANRNHASASPVNVLTVSLIEGARIRVTIARK